MNKRQQTILHVCIALIVAMLLFPPFHVRLANGIVANLGYGFLLDPPLRGSIAGSIDVSVLIVQWVAVILVCGVLWWLAKGPDATPGAAGAATESRKSRRFGAKVLAFFVVVVVLALSKGFVKALMHKDEPTSTTNYFDRFDTDQPKSASIWDEFVKQEERSARSGRVGAVRTDTDRFDVTQMRIEQFRKAYPQYNALSDEDLAHALHAKYYPDADYGHFASAFGVKPVAADQ